MTMTQKPQSQKRTARRSTRSVVHTEHVSSTRTRSTTRKSTRQSSTTRMVRNAKQKTSSNALQWVLTAFLLVGVGLIGYGGYSFVYGKIQENKAYAEANTVLKDRDVLFEDVGTTVEEQEPTLLDMYYAKEKWINDGGLVQGEAIGKLIIPKTDSELPIVEGADPDSLRKGVGHMATTFLPLDNDQIVLSGHRDTVFRGVASQLDVGDTFIVQLPYGDFEYEITETKIVSGNDRTVIVPHDEETLTVTTCYPFNFIGNAPDRYIMTAKPTFDMSELVDTVHHTKSFKSVTQE